MMAPKRTAAVAKSTSAAKTTKKARVTFADDAHDDSDCTAAATLSTEDQEGGEEEEEEPASEQDKTSSDGHKLQETLTQLFNKVDGYSISKAERQRLREQGVFNGSLTYGEVDMAAFKELLSQADPKEGDVFYDIGSGTGKALMTAAAFFPFSKAVGIEILEDLHEAASVVIEKGQSALELFACKNVSAVLHDSFKYDWTDGDVVFAAATCFDDEMMAQYLDKVLKLKSGARIVSLTRALTHPELRLAHNRRYKYAKGAINAFVYVRL